MRAARVAVLVHGSSDSVEGVRARGLTRRVNSDRVRLLFREEGRLSAARLWHRRLRADRPDLLYVVGTALPGVPLAVWWRWRHGVPYILDTGDLVYEMARRSGVGAGWRLPLVWSVEQLAWRMAARIVVRGTLYVQYLEQRALPATLVRDGCAEEQEISEDSVAAVRSRLGLCGRFVVGLMGSLVYSPRLRICYGWDLIRALPGLRDVPVTGVIIGDGPGRAWLEAEARRLRVEDRVVFTGRVPYSDVPLYLRLLDVALSTQTNNLPARVRTTGKLPEYMAAARFILASRVGEAEHLLPPEMLVPFEGEVDLEYPGRLAARIRELVSNPLSLEPRHRLPLVARERCSYDVLSRRWLEVVDEVAGR